MRVRTLAQRHAQLAPRHSVHIVKRHAVNFLAVCQTNQGNVFLDQQFQQLAFAQIHQLGRGFLHLRGGKALGGSHKAGGFVMPDAKLTFHNFQKPPALCVFFQYNQSTPQFKHSLHCLPNRMATAFNPCCFVINFTVSPLLHYHHAMRCLIILISGYIRQCDLLFA